MEQEYDELFKAMEKIEPEEEQALIKICEKNSWLYRIYNEEYGFCRLESLAFLKTYFSFGNWSLKQGVLFDNLVFVHQGEDDWWVLRRAESEVSGQGIVYTPIESCSMYCIVTNKVHRPDGYLPFEELIEHLKTMELPGEIMKKVAAKEYKDEKRFGYYKCTCKAEYILNYPFMECQCPRCLKLIPLIKKISAEEAAVVQESWKGRP